MINDHVERVSACHCKDRQSDKTGDRGTKITGYANRPATDMDTVVSSMLNASALARAN